jgi:hypothetical protein
MRQVEYATDIMFEDHKSLAQIYPSLVNAGINQFSSQDVKEDFPDLYYKAHEDQLNLRALCVQKTATGRPVVVLRHNSY